MRRRWVTPREIGVGGLSIAIEDNLIVLRHGSEEVVMTEDSWREAKRYVEAHKL